MNERHDGDVSLPLLDPDIEDARPGHATRPTLLHAGAVFVGGSLGTVARYGVTAHVHLAPNSFPWTIMTINTVGALLLGILGGSLFTARPDAVTLRLFLGTGVLGGWTTFSSIITGLLTLGHLGSWGTAALNLIMALILPLAAVCTGIAMGSAFIRNRATT